MRTTFKKNELKKFQAVKISTSETKKVKGGVTDYVIIEEIVIG